MDNNEFTYEHDKLELKKKIIDEQMERFWDFTKDAHQKNQEREQWEREADMDFYSNGERVIPESLQEFATTFLAAMNEILAKI